MNQHNETQFEQRARNLLRDSVEGLDSATRSRLTQARMAALAQRETRARWFNFRYLAPVGALAAALLLTVLVLLPDASTDVNESAGSALYDLDLLADADAYELTQETDLEFIEWAAAMGEQEKTGT